jgi:hypothetical protein
MRRSIPDHGSRKLPVINALDGAITIDKEIDLEEEYQFSHEEGTDSEADCESSAPSPARAQGSTGGAGGETKRKAGSEASVVTLKPANGGQGKTGQREWPGLCCFYTAESCGGKSVLVRQLRGPHLRTWP